MRDDFRAEWTSPRTSKVVMDELLDVERVASWLPILSDVREERRLEKYRGVLEDRLGSFRLRADLDIDVAVAPDRINLAASGSDRQIGSRLALRGELVVASQPDGCHVTVSGDYEVSGKAAALGSSSIRRKASKLFTTFCEHLEHEVVLPLNAE